MTSLKKATLQEISADSSATPVPGTELEVQFNPQSLKLVLATQAEGGDKRARQNRQYLGKTSTTLSFDLYFDTADLGSTKEPVSVRTQTAMIERFVLPKGKGNSKQQPPRCRFHWDELVLDGIIETVSIDFDLFAANGTPLRAKIGVSLKEQDAKYELLESGPGANQARDVPAPGKPGNGPGSGGGGFTDSSAQALAGESAADFAVRVGLDPSAWRGIAAQLGGGSSLSLQAGLSIGFSTSLSAGIGIGVSAGIELDADVSLDASFGLSASASIGSSAGFALSAAGGLGSALATVASVEADAAAAKSRRAFASAVPATGAGRVSATATETPPVSTTPKPALPTQIRTPLKLGASSAAPSATAPSAPPPPKADPRATSFGLGVPLRPRSAETVAMAQTSQTVASRPNAGTGRQWAVADPSTPAWINPPTAVGSAAGLSSRPTKRPCGCK